ncbi:MAG: sacC [Phycisphaerales bacterium]|nr:sacC [Phycisphaerales bacterium]
MTHRTRAAALALAACAAASPSARAVDRPDVVLADFEGTTYASWVAAGTAFGDGPARGALPGQMPVNGFAGKGLVNSYHGGDRSTGTLTSPPFTIDRKYVSFLIGGGGFAGKTCVDLVVDEQAVRTATGPNTVPGGSEALGPAAWDVTELAGKTARLRVVDAATGGWGHVTLDQVVFTDAKPPAAAVLREKPSVVVTSAARWLNLPVKNGAKPRQVTVSVGGRVVRSFTIEAADGDPDWWAAVDVSAWAKQPLTVQVDRLPDDSQFLANVDAGDARKGRRNLYREPLRPQFHFSPARGWLNDPNGLSFYNGEYHLFFQFNPYGTKWGNMHWGHAVSTDLLHWRELGVALYPDALGMMYSGSAVVDWANTSGLGSPGKPPLVLAYTADGADVQCLASSTDGRAFAKFAANPVVPKITGGNRDPKVFWHEPTKRWVMALYVGERPPMPKAAKAETVHTVRFLTSPDMKAWTESGRIEGYYECPDLFPLAVDGDATDVRWVLTAANSDYQVGTFDGKTFAPQTPILKGHRGKGFYAAQTFSDLPAAAPGTAPAATAPAATAPAAAAGPGRRVMVGWFQTPSPGMPFNQSMTVPLDVRLLATADGPRLSYLPASELAALRAGTTSAGPLDLKPGDANPLAAAAGELLDVRAEFEPGDAAEVAFDVRGVPVVYDAKRQELSVNGHRAPAPLRDGRVRLVVLADRNSFEVFAADGLTYVPMPVIPKPENRSVSIAAKGGTAKVRSLEVHALNSIWPAAAE